MKTFILLLILAIFLQTTLIPANLCLIMLVCRSLIIDDKTNLYLGFLSGVALGFLSSVNIGFYTLIFLIYICSLSFFKKSQFSSNFLLFLPLALVIYLITAVLEKIILAQSLSFYKIILELVLTIPFYFVVRFWEERFIPRSGVKLKI